jgi:hypothetical protein
MCQQKKVHSDNSIEQGMTSNGNESNIMLVPKLMLKCNAGTLSNVPVAFKYAAPFTFFVCF